MVAWPLRADRAPGKLNFMCRMTFAAIAAAAAMSPLEAQQVPGRDLFYFPLGALAEAPALASAAGGGFWNPATIALLPDDRARLAAAALSSASEQGVTGQIGTGAVRLRSGITIGISVAQSGVEDLQRTDTDPQSLGEIGYGSTIVSAIVAGARGPGTYGVAVRHRTGTVDIVSGRATSVDAGVVVDRPRRLPLRAAVSTFLLSPSRDLERASGFAAVEGYLRQRNDLRAGISWQQDEGGGSDGFLYASGRAGPVDLRGGMARHSNLNVTTTRLRLAVGVRHARYHVGVAREDGTAGFGASYQFQLTSVFPGARR